MPLCDAASKLIGLENHQGTESPARSTAPQSPIPGKCLPLAAEGLPYAYVAELGFPSVLRLARSTHRDDIAHGAIRCDCDVGLHLLDRTLLI